MITPTPIQSFSSWLKSITKTKYTLPPIKPSFKAWPAVLDMRIISALNAEGFSKAYSHQADAIESAINGEHVGLVTPTASGKTLSFMVPIAQSVSEYSNAHAIIIYPTKALTLDQIGSAKRLSESFKQFGISLTGGKYDGDTNSRAKSRIRSKQPNIIFTNPDMLHYAILRFPEKWTWLFKNLNYVVTDEAHSLRGYFGTNVALILRRLRQLCKIFGSSPTFIAASATLDDSASHLKRLTGLDFKIISKSGAGNGSQDIFVLDQFNKYGVEHLANEALKLGLQGILFCNTRKRVEELAAILRPKWGAQIEPYRGGYSAKLRRNIHDNLKSGKTRLVVSTNALELGIDIGNLEVAILDGLPLTNSEIWQRIGRVGRDKNSESVAVIALSDSAMDKYYAANPIKIIQNKIKPERAVITPSNTELLKKHLACAKIESKGRRFVSAVFPEEAKKLFKNIETPAKPYRAYKDIDIRNISSTIRIFDTTVKKEIGFIERNVAHRHVHYGAIYVHGGDRYRCKNRERAGRVTRVNCEPEQDLDLSTRPMANFTATLIENRDSFGLHKYDELQVGVLYGKFILEDFTNGYTESNRETGSQTSHSIYKWGIKHEGDAFAFVLGRQLTEELEGHSAIAPVALLHSLSHLFVATMWEDGVCERGDVMEFAVGYSPELDGPVLYIGETTAYGLGFAEDVFNRFEDYLIAAQKRIMGCKCRAGCPNCLILKGRCPQWNEPLDKTLTRDLLSQIGKHSSKDRKGWKPPPKLPPPPKKGEWKDGQDYHGAIVEEKTKRGLIVKTRSGEIRYLPWK